MMFRALMLIPCLLLALACGGPEAAENVAESAVAEPVERSVAVETVIVSARQVVDRASLSADLQPVRRATLAAEVAGTVETLSVDDGDTVRAGEPLIAIDTRALDVRLAEAKAVDRQRRLQFERAEKLLEKRSITRVQFLDAVTARDVAAAQLASAELDLAKATVQAPWSGRVGVTRVEEGDYVVPGQPVVELVDVSRLEVVAPAPAGDVPYLQVGVAADVTVDVFPGQVFRGRVSRLATELDPDARTLDVVVALDDTAVPGGGRLRPGLSARIDLARRTLDAAVAIPLSATIELEDGRAVYVVEAGRAVRRAVRLGPTVRDPGGNGDRVVIESGLDVGDQLVVRGQRRLSPGQPVEIVTSDTTASEGAAP